MSSTQDGGEGSASLFDQGNPPADPPPADPPPADPPPADPPPADPPQSWKWHDGLEGEGDRPDWLIEKYGSVQAQAEAVNGLNEQIGKAGRYFGVPESGTYEFTMPEGVDGEIDVENDTLIQGFNEVASRLGLSQEAYNELTGLYIKDLTEAAAEAEAEQAAEAKRQAESIHNFESRRDALRTTLESRMDAEEAKVLMDSSTTAAHFQALEKAMRSETRVPRTPAASTKLTPQELNDMRRETYPEGHPLAGKEKYVHDAEHRKRVDAAYAAAYPGEDVQVVGADTS